MKAELSFKFSKLDLREGHKDKITKYDLEKLTYEVSVVWKCLTGTKGNNLRIIKILIMINFKLKRIISNLNFLLL